MLILLYLGDLEKLFDYFKELLEKSTKYNLLVISALSYFPLTGKDLNMYQEIILSSLSVVEENSWGVVLQFLLESESESDYRSREVNIIPKVDL